MPAEMGDLQEAYFMHTSCENSRFQVLLSLLQSLFFRVSNLGLGRFVLCLGSRVQRRVPEISFF